MKVSDLYKDYQPTNDPFTEEDENVSKVKTIIFSDVLSEAERRIIILYAEYQSLRELGKTLGISTASAWIAVNKIRRKIIDAYVK